MHCKLGLQELYGKDPLIGDQKTLFVKGLFLKKVATSQCSNTRMKLALCIFIHLSLSWSFMPNTNSFWHLLAFYLVTNLLLVWFKSNPKQYSKSVTGNQYSSWEETQEKGPGLNYWDTGAEWYILQHFNT